MNKPKHAPHSMVMYKVTVNHRGDPEDLFSVNDINGKTLAELFLRFCDSVQGDFITQENSLKHVIVKDSRAIPNRTAAMAYLASGSSGEDFEVFDTASAVKESEFDSTRATLVNSRCFVSCEYGDGYALMCIEHSTNAAGDTALFTPFRRYLRIIDDEAVIEFEPVTEREALEAFTAVDSIVVKKYLEPKDITDTLVREGDCVTLSLTHKRRSPFNKGIVHELIYDRGRAATLFGLTGDIFNSDSTTITVNMKGANGRKGKFVIGGEATSKAREGLNDNGAPPLSDGDFIQRCDDRCALAAERLGTMFMD